MNRRGYCNSSRVAGANDCIRISVSDNGVGIPSENLTRTFTQKFTTQKHGHGFGLHSGTLVAKDMGSSPNVHSDGSRRVLESHANPIPNACGEMEHLVIVAPNIAEHKKVEEERQQMEVQLRHARRMESIGQLAAGVAHEINTPTQLISDNDKNLQTDRPVPV